jgi:hypothetical protein
MKFGEREKLEGEGSMELRLEMHAQTLADANRNTTDLEQLLKRLMPAAAVTRVRSSDQTQDAGTVLVAVLAAPAAVALAKGPALELARGVADWLRKRRVTVTLSASGQARVENVPAEDAERIILSLLQSQKK